MNQKDTLDDYVRVFSESDFPNTFLLSYDLIIWKNYGIYMLWVLRQKFLDASNPVSFL